MSLGVTDWCLCAVWNAFIWLVNVEMNEVVLRRRRLYERSVYIAKTVALVSMIRTSCWRCSALDKMHKIGVKIQKPLEILDQGSEK